MYPPSMFWSKIKKNIFKNSTENFQFLQLQKNLYITWACFRKVMEFLPIKIVHFLSSFGIITLLHTLGPEIP